MCDRIINLYEAAKDAHVPDIAHYEGTIDGVYTIMGSIFLISLKVQRTPSVYQVSDFNWNTPKYRKCATKKNSGLNAYHYSSISPIQIVQYKLNDVDLGRDLELGLHSCTVLTNGERWGCIVGRDESGKCTFTTMHIQSNGIGECIHTSSIANQALRETLYEFYKKDETQTTASMKTCGNNALQLFGLFDVHGLSLRIQPGTYTYSPIKVGKSHFVLNV
jgi:hypothetical protein